MAWQTEHKIIVIFNDSSLKDILADTGSFMEDLIKASEKAAAGEKHIPILVRGKIGAVVTGAVKVTSKEAGSA